MAGRGLGLPRAGSERGGFSLRWQPLHEAASLLARAAGWASRLWRLCGARQRQLRLTLRDLREPSREQQRALHLGRNTLTLDQIHVLACPPPILVALPGETSPLLVASRRLSRTRSPPTASYARSWTRLVASISGRPAVTKGGRGVLCGGNRCTKRPLYPLTASLARGGVDARRHGRLRR